MRHKILKKIEAVAIGGTIVLSTIGHVVFATENSDISNNLQQKLFCGEGWKYDGYDTLYIKNLLPMAKDYTYYGVKQPWQDFKDKIKKIIIDCKVTKISGGAFCNFVNLEKIMIPNSINVIESKAFLNCKNLHEIKIPDSVKFMGDSAFSGCTNLKNISLSKRLSGIGGHTFDGCTSLTKIIIPKSVKYIGAKAFYGCSNLLNFILENPSSLRKIEKNVFDYCTGLNNIIIS